MYLFCEGSVGRWLTHYYRTRTGKKKKRVALESSRAVAQHFHEYDLNKVVRGAGELVD